MFFLFFYTIKNVDTQSNNKVIGSLSLCLSVSLSRFTFKTAEPIEIIFGGNLPLGPGVVLSKYFPYPSTGSPEIPEKPVFTVVYYRNRMSSNS